MSSTHGHLKSFFQPITEYNGILLSAYSSNGMKVAKSEFTPLEFFGLTTLRRQPEYVWNPFRVRENLDEAETKTLPLSPALLLAVLKSGLVTALDVRGQYYVNNIPRISEDEIFIGVQVVYHNCDFAHGVDIYTMVIIGYLLALLPHMKYGTTGPWCTLVKGLARNRGEFDVMDMVFKNLAKNISEQPKYFSITL